MFKELYVHFGPLGGFSWGFIEDKISLFDQLNKIFFQMKIIHLLFIRNLVLDTDPDSLKYLDTGFL
jgi:hypothetical protein